MNKMFRRSRAGLPLLVAVLTAGMLSGCAEIHGEDPYFQGWTSTDANVMHPIEVSQSPVSMELELPQGGGLSKRQLFDARAFIIRFKREAGGPLNIAVMRGGASEAEVGRALVALRELLDYEHVPGAAVSVASYGSSRSGTPALRLSFSGYNKVKAPDCGYWPKNVAQSPYNTPHWNYACADQHNIAVLAANPRDLLGPRPVDPRASERRDTTWIKYVKGETTESDSTKVEKKSTVSEAAE